MGEYREAAVSVLLALVAVGWLIAVPFLVFQGVVGNIAGTHGGDGYLSWAAWLGAGLPLLGVVVSATTRRRGWTWFFGICLTLVAVGWALEAAHDYRHRPPPPPGPRHCVERSGGDNDCPGG